MAKATRVVHVTCMQWIGTRGSLIQVEKLLEREDLIVSDRKQFLTIPSTTPFKKDVTVPVNQWIVKDEGKIKIVSPGVFNSTYILS